MKIHPSVFMSLSNPLHIMVIPRASILFVMNRNFKLSLMVALGFQITQSCCRMSFHDFLEVFSLRASAWLRFGGVYT